GRPDVIDLARQEVVALLQRVELPLRQEVHPAEEAEPPGDELRTPFELAGGVVVLEARDRVGRLELVALLAEAFGLGGAALEVGAGAVLELVLLAEAVEPTGGLAPLAVGLPLGFGGRAVGRRGLGARVVRGGDVALHLGQERLRADAGTLRGLELLLETQWVGRLECLAFAVEAGEGPPPARGGPPGG